MTTKPGEVRRWVDFGAVEGMQALVVVAASDYDAAQAEVSD